LLLPPPPPQPGANTIKANIARRIRDLCWRGEPPTSTTEKSMKPARVGQLAGSALCGGSSMAVVPAAVVVTVIAEEVVVGVPVAVIGDWLNRQVAPLGNPEHARVMVPVNPVEEETETEVEPDEPGAETRTC